MNKYLAGGMNSRVSCTARREPLCSSCSAAFREPGRRHLPGVGAPASCSLSPIDTIEYASPTEDAPLGEAGYRVATRSPRTTCASGAAWCRSSQSGTRDARRMARCRGAYGCDACRGFGRLFDRGEHRTALRRRQIFRLGLPTWQDILTREFEPLIASMLRLIRQAGPLNKARRAASGVVSASVGGSIWHLAASRSTNLQIFPDRLPSRRGRASKAMRAGAVADKDAVADLHRLVDVVGDEDCGLAVLPHQPH